MKKLLSIYDRKVQSYSVPFGVEFEAEGIRFFDDLCRNSDGMIGKYPEDFDLYLVGTMDCRTGEVTPVWPCKFIVNGGATVEVI